MGLVFENPDEHLRKVMENYNFNPDHFFVQRNLELLRHLFGEVSDVYKTYWETAKKYLE